MATAVAVCRALARIPTESDVRYSLTDRTRFLALKDSSLRRPEQAPRRSGKTKMFAWYAAAAARGLFRPACFGLLATIAGIQEF
jgi:hypothetical protein